MTRVPREIREYTADKRAAGAPVETIVTINAGSSSVRLAAFAVASNTLSLVASESLPRHVDAPPGALSSFLERNRIGDVSLVAHRVVHGGMHRSEACRLDRDVEADIAAAAGFAPLHNPPALEWISAGRTALGSTVVQVAVFDTAFYAGLPEVAKTYALPQALVRKHQLRRYGFHGLAHRALWQRWCALRSPARGSKNTCAISLQLGAGCSATAVRDGRPMDTSMGFSPLEGLVMATRSGDLDPGLLTHLMRAERLSADDLQDLLNRDSGLKGISEATGDMRILLASKSRRARLAVDTYCYRVRKYIGAYVAVLGTTQAILFGGGVGENAPQVRDKILEGLQTFGIILDRAANANAKGTEALISAPDSKVEVWVIPVDEARILAEEAYAVWRPLAFHSTSARSSRPNSLGRNNK